MADDRGLTLRAGVVGYGAAGRGIHARLLRQAGHTVTDVVTSDAGRAEQAAQDWPGVRVHADVHALLQHAEALDVVVVASPSGRHGEHTSAVLAAGTPVVVEKPLAVDADAARTLVREAERATVPLTVFHNRRWDGEQLTLRRLLERGALGRVHRFERRWERWRPQPKARWKEMAVDDGGGLLLDLGSHLVDSAVDLFGPVSHVYAELRSLLTPTEDDVFLALMHVGGTISHLWAGGLVGAPGPRTRVSGSAGGYLVTSFEGEPTPFADLDPGEGCEGWLVHGDQREPVRRAPGEHADFYRATARWLLAGGSAPVDPWDAVRTAAVLDAARRSAQSGRREPVTG
jgi:predicted dehydrogenase